jgi:Zn-finger nucleic acid-binding protein
MFSVLAAFLAPPITDATPSAPYRWLTTGELESLLRESWIVEADNRPRYMHTPEHFQSNGHYVRYDDNFEAHGKYTFRNGKVCAQAEREPEFCRGVLVNKDGAYWIVGRYNQRLVKIFVKPLR